MTEFIKKFPNFNYTHSVIKSGNYTLTTTDQHVKLSATGTLTLPATSTLAAAGKANIIYVMEIGAASVTGTFSCNSADTINGSGTTIATSTNGDKIALEADPANSNWILVNIAPSLPTANYQDGSVTTPKIADDAITGAKLSIGAHYGIKVVETNGTTAVNVFDASGAPAALTITGVMAVAKDTVANTEVVLTNGTLAVATFDKLNTVGWVIAEETDMTNESVTSGDTLTVVTDTTGNAQVWITFESA